RQKLIILRSEVISPMTNYRSARAGAVKPLRLVAQPLRALGLDRSARPSKEACRDMNAGNSLEGTAFGKKVRKKRSRQPQKLLTRETSYMVFGRRHIAKDAEHSGPAYENRQRTKPREKVRTAVPRSAYQRAPEAGFLYNLSVMARRL